MRTRALSLCAIAARGGERGRARGKGEIPKPEGREAKERVVGMGGEVVRMDAREGTGEDQAPESRRKLISLAHGVLGLSEMALLAFNLSLDTASCGSLASSGRQRSRCLRVKEEGRFQSQALLCGFWFGFFFLLPPSVWAIISLEQSWRIFCFSSRVPPCCTNTLVGN